MTFTSLFSSSRLEEDERSLEERNLADCVVAVKTPPKVDRSSITPVKVKSSKISPYVFDIEDMNLGVFSIEESPISRFDVVSIRSVLSAIRIASLGFFCDLLDEIDRKKSLVEICLIEGSSRKFNIIFPTLKKIYDKHALTGDVINIIYSTTSGSQRAYEQLYTLKSASPISRTKLGSVAGCNPKGFSSPSTNEVPIKSCEARDISDFAQTMSSLVIKKEKEDRKKEFTWCTEKYGVPNFGIESHRDIAEISLADEDVLFWLDGIENKEEIKLISFSQAGINDRDVDNIAEKLTAFTNLAVLDVSFNSLTLECAESISRLLERVKFINVTNTDLMEDYGQGESNLISYLRTNDQEDLVWKIIWYGSDETIILGDFVKLLKDDPNKDKFISSHITYAHIDKLLCDIREQTKLVSLSASLTVEN